MIIGRNIYLLLSIYFFSAYMRADDSVDAEDIAREELYDILTDRPFDRNEIKDKKTKLTFQGRNFSLNRSGKLFTQFNNKRVPVQIYHDKASGANSRIYLIFDPHKPPIAGLDPNPLSTRTATNEQTNIIDDIVSAQRKYGIYSTKSKNPDCYFAYAESRLKTHPLERLLALERPDNPRPLVFENDIDWEDFKKDLKDLFSAFKGPDSYAVILGTSTTFFSENPRKGKNAPLFETAPKCIKRANDDILSRDVYTFDTPGAEPSDVDIDLFIPSLGALCEQAGVGGNNGLREVYFENTMDQCLRLSTDKSVRDMVTPLSSTKVQSLLGSALPNKPLGKFIKKWRAKMNNREINFSIQIPPNIRKQPLYRPEDNFAGDPYLKTRFVIPID